MNISLPPVDPALAGNLPINAEKAR